MILQNILWLIIILVLIFAIAFLVIAPLHDEAYNKLRGYCKKDCGFHHVKVSDRARASDGDAPMLIINDDINPALHLQRGREYVFWLEDDPRSEDRLTFDTMKLCCEDKEHLEQIYTCKDATSRLYSIKPTNKSPAQFHYGTHTHPRIGHVFLFD